MCILRIQDLYKYPSRTLIYFTADPDDHPYIGESYTFLVHTDVNKLVNELRLLLIDKFPVICYDNEDLSLASRAFWIFDAMDYSVFVIATSRGALRPQKSLGSLPVSPSLNHIDLSKISSSMLTQTCEFTLQHPILPNISSDFSEESIKAFLEDQEIPFENLNCQLKGFYAEQIALLLKFLGNIVGIVLVDLRCKTKTVSSGRDETFYSVPESVYFDAEDDARSKASNKAGPKFNSCVKEDEVQKQEIEKEDNMETETITHYSSVIPGNVVKSPKNPPISSSKRCHCLIF